MSKRIFKQKRRGRYAITAFLVAALFVPAAGALAAPPANDDFAAPVAISSLPYSNVLLTNEATSSPTDPNCFGGGRTVWYSLTVAEATRVSIDTLESNYDSTLGVYSGDAGALTEIACNDNYGWARQSRVAFDAAADTTYHVMVGSLATGPRGTLRLNVTTAAAPGATNDVEPKVISEVPFTETVDMSAASASTTDPNCAESAQTVWYSYSPVADRRFQVDTSESLWDTVVAIYEQEGAGLSEIICTDSPTARFDGKAGATYMIMVGTWYDAPADVLVFSFDAAPPPVEIEAKIDGEGKVRNLTGAARIGFRVKCSQAVDAWARGRVKQRQGDRLVSAGFGMDVDCGTRWGTATISANPDRRAFRAGAAVVSLRVSSWDELDEYSVFKRRIVDLN